MASKKRNTNSFKELVRQIEAYGLKEKLHEIAVKEAQRRPFKHLPKQFSKGILIGNVAIVPKKDTGTRYVYIIADMVQAKVLYESIALKQTAIMVAHHLAEESVVPTHILEKDTHFASQLFKITNANRMLKMALKQKDDNRAEIYQQRLDDANYLADNIKKEIQQNFSNTFAS